jgi:acyl-CoA dehydrogenase
MLGEGGWLEALDHRSRPARHTGRSLALPDRETLARHDGLADFAFAMQGLGTGAISLFGSARAKGRVAEEVSRR